MKFKIGDIVGCIYRDSYFYGVAFEIIETDASDFEAFYLCESHKYNITAWLSEEEIALINEA